MIFNTFEPYDNDHNVDNNYIIGIKNKINKSSNNIDDINNVNNKIFDYEKECFICMESNLNSDLIELKNIHGYHKKCNCNALIHIYCFNKWISIKCICPICRMNMDKIINYENNIGTINTHNSVTYNRFEIEYTNNNVYHNNYHNYMLLVKVSYYMWSISFFIYLIYYLCIQFNLYNI